MQNMELYLVEFLYKKEPPKSIPLKILQPISDNQRITKQPAHKMLQIQANYLFTD